MKLRGLVVVVLRCASSFTVSLPTTTTTTTTTSLRSSQKLRFSPTKRGPLDPRNGRTTTTPPRAVVVPRGGGGASSSTTTTPAKARPSLASLWGAAGVVAILMNAVKRVLPIALEPFKSGMRPALWVAYGAFAAFMGYAEGWKAFHRKFSPLVASRSRTLDAPHPASHVLLAPFYAMGLFHATPKRRITSWAFLGIVFVAVKLVKQLAYPWRSIVDGGVVVGLTVGSLSIAYHYVNQLRGVPPPVDPCLPTTTEDNNDAK